MAGGTIKIVANVSKVIPKAFEGAKFLRPLASYINDKVLKSGDWDAGRQAMLTILPFMEVAAFVGYTAFSDEGKEIRDFMKAAIQDSEDLDTWVKYLSDMSKAVTNGLLAEHDLDLSDQAKRALYALVSEVLVEQAFAGIADDLASKTVTEFIKIINEARKPPVIGESTEIAKIFTNAIFTLSQAAKNGAKELDDILYKPSTVKALVNVYVVV